MLQTILLIALQLGASGADAYYTDRNLRLPVHYEANPIARQFVGSQAGRIAYFSAGAGLKITIPLILKKKHPKLSRTIALAGIADNGLSAVYSERHKK